MDEVRYHVISAHRRCRDRCAVASFPQWMVEKISKLYRRNLAWGVKTCISIVDFTAPAFGLVSMDSVVKAWFEEEVPRG